MSAKPQRNNINKIIHEPIRFQIMCILHNLEYADFTFLKKELGVTAGNLSFHLKKLEHSKLIEVKKSFVKQKPLTTYKMTKAGETAFKEYYKQTSEIIKKYLIDL